MRKLVIGALAGVLTLALAAVAIAASGTSGTTVQNYEQTFSAKKPKKSTGTTFSTSSIDEQNPNNKQPKRVTNFDITFPPGTKINNKAIPRCRATQNDFASAQNPDDACPKGSRIGRPGTKGDGGVKARLKFPGSAEINGEVFAYNANKGLLLFVNLSSANQTLLLKPKFRGRRLLTTVPHTCVPPGTPANGCRDNQGNVSEAILTSFDLKTLPKSKGRGKKKKQLITTPGSCPSSGSWKFEANIKYGDGTSLKIPETSPCRK
jgi:hypothetical protein